MMMTVPTMKMAIVILRMMMIALLTMITSMI